MKILRIRVMTHQTLSATCTKEITDLRRRSEGQGSGFPEVFFERVFPDPFRYPLFETILHAQYCTILHNIAQYCAILHNIAQYCTILHTQYCCRRNNFCNIFRGPVRGNASSGNPSSSEVGLLKCGRLFRFCIWGDGIRFGRALL